MTDEKIPTSWTYSSPGTAPTEEGNDHGAVTLTYETRDPHGLVAQGWTETANYDCPVAAEVAEIEARVHAETEAQRLADEAHEMAEAARAEAEHAEGEGSSLPSRSRAKRKT